MTKPENFVGKSAGTTPTPSPALLSFPNPASETLTLLLQTETKARLAAESSLSQGHSELEDLKAQLFGQANEMVANERKARTKLEERIETDSGSWCPGVKRMQQPLAGEPYTMFKLTPEDSKDRRLSRPRHRINRASSIVLKINPRSF